MKTQHRAVFPSLILCLVLVALTALPPATVGAAPPARSAVVTRSVAFRPEAISSNLSQTIAHGLASISTFFDSLEAWSQRLGNRSPSVSGIVTHARYPSRFSATAISSTPQAIEISPALSQPTDPTCPAPCVYNTVNASFDYVSGPAMLSGNALAPMPWAKDDGIRIIFLDSGTQITRISLTADQPAEDISSYLHAGTNALRVESLDVIGPERGGGTVWLLVGEDTVPPTISDVTWRQDGAGRTIIMATITDNVAVAAASVWWNGAEHPMQLMGPDLYYAIVSQEPNGVIGNFKITATDPSGNLACWPDGCGTQSERIRYLIWAGMKANTFLTGEPVNTATGSFFTQHQDLYAPAPGTPFEFKRTYNSIAAALDGPLGFGWTHNFSLRLQVVDDPLLHGVVVTYADGHVANFEASGSGYTSPPGDNNTLAHEGSGFVLSQPDLVKYHFDAAGKLVSIEDRNSNATQFAYTGDNLTQITDTAGRVYRLEYTGQHITKITDVLGRSYEYIYDGAGNLAMYKGPDGGMLRYTYDGEHWLLSITDPNGHTFITNTYDDRGRVVSQRDASGSVSTFEYVDERHVVFTDNEGNKTTYVYDDELRIIETIDARGYSTKYTYDADNNPIRVTDKGGHTTASTFDSSGNLLTRTDALGQMATFQYDAHNNPTFTRDEAGAEATFEYDARGNQTRIHDAEGGDTWMTYDSRGLMRTRKDANGHVTEYAYDSQGNQILVRDPMGNETHYDYDAMGRQIAITDANGHTARFEYNPSDRLTRTVDAKGKATDFVYDPVGNLLSVTDRRGFKTSYEYDVNDSLIKVTDPLGHFTRYTYDLMYHRTGVANRRGFVTRYEYDDVYNVITAIDAKNFATRFTYNPDGNLLTTTDALGTLAASYEYDALHRVKRLTTPVGYSEYAYDPVGRIVALRDPKGGVTRSEYDQLGRLRKVKDALLNAATYAYDPVGSRLTATNARGFTTRYEYDAVNQLIRQIDPLGHAVAFTYDGVGNVKTRTDARNGVTSSFYDENDNLVKVIDALGGQVVHAYDEENNRIATTDQNGNTTTTEYDAVANPFRVRLPLGQATGYEYDENGNVVKITNAKGKVTQLGYDELDLLIRRTDPLSYATAYEYDALGRLVMVTDAENNATRYDYDAAGRLVQVTDALGNRAKYEYDPLGNLTAFVDANTHRTEFGVDLLGRRIQEVNPLGKVWRYEFDGVGNLAKRTDANGVVTRYTFDGDNRLTRTAYPSGAGVTYAYDESDNLVGLVDGSGRTAFAYDLLNRITQVQRASGILVGKTLQYGYDPVNNRTAITYPDGKVMRYEYNANNWLTSALDPAAGATQYTYDPVGLAVRITNPNGTWTDTGYDDADRPVRIFNGKRTTSTDLISSFDYTLDKVGNRTRTVEKVTRGQVITWAEDDTYDKLYRLTQAIETPDYNPAQPHISQFVYDAVGNRLSQTTNIQDAPNTPPLPQPVTTTYTYNTANQMLTAGPVQFRYDANGNRVAMSGPTRAIDFTYDFENRLSGANTFDVLANGKRQKDAALDFTYDGLGRRLERGISEKGVRKTGDFLYDGLGYDLVAQYLSHGNPRTTFYFRDLTRMLARYEYSDTEPGQWFSYHQNGLGSISAWSNATGAAVQEYKYAPYGRLIDNNGPDNTSNSTGPLNSITFSGKIWDREMETYYFGARDYDPGPGVWLTQDPYRGKTSQPASLHRYQYVGNNPVSAFDRDGYYAVGATEAPMPVPVPTPSPRRELNSSSATISKLKISETLSTTGGNALMKSMCGGYCSRWDTEPIPGSFQFYSEQAAYWALRGATSLFADPLSAVTSHADLIRNAARKYGIDAALLGAIILREQQTRALEPAWVGDSVGLGQVRVSVWGERFGYSRDELLRPEINIDVVARILRDEKNDLMGKGIEPTAAAIATRYHCSSVDNCCGPVISSYGSAVAQLTESTPSLLLLGLDPSTLPLESSSRSFGQFDMRANEAAPSASLR